MLTHRVALRQFPECSAEQGAHAKLGGFLGCRDKDESLGRPRKLEFIGLNARTPETCKTSPSNIQQST